MFAVNAVKRLLWGNPQTPSPVSTTASGDGSPTSSSRAAEGRTEKFVGLVTQVMNTGAERAVYKRLKDRVQQARELERRATQFDTTRTQRAVFAHLRKGMSFWGQLERAGIDVSDPKVKGLIEQCYPQYAQEGCRLTAEAINEIVDLVLMFQMTQRDLQRLEDRAVGTGVVYGQAEIFAELLGKLKNERDPQIRTRAFRTARFFQELIPMDPATQSIVQRCYSEYAEGYRPHDDAVIEELKTLAQGQQDIQSQRDINKKIQLEAKMQQAQLMNICHQIIRKKGLSQAQATALLTWVRSSFPKECASGANVNIDAAIAEQLLAIPELAKTEVSDLLRIFSPQVPQQKLVELQKTGILIDVLKKWLAKEKSHYNVQLMIPKLMQELSVFRNWERDIHTFLLTKSARTKEGTKIANLLRAFLPVLEALRKKVEDQEVPVLLRPLLEVLGGLDKAIIEHQEPKPQLEWALGLLETAAQGENNPLRPILDTVRGLVQRGMGDPTQQLKEVVKILHSAVIQNFSGLDEQGIQGKAVGILNALQKAWPLVLPLYSQMANEIDPDPKWLRPEDQDAYNNATSRIAQDPVKIQVLYENLVSEFSSREAQFAAVMALVNLRTMLRTAQLGVVKRDPLKK